MDSFIKSLDESMVHLCNLGMLVESMDRDYGIGFEISPKEIHFIEAVHNHPQFNSTELSLELGLRKGTFSKLGKKIEGRKLIERYQQKDNQKEVYYKLTDLGQKAFEGHYKFHEHISKKTYEKFARYTKQEEVVIMQFVKSYIEYLKEYLEV